MCSKIMAQLIYSAPAPALDFAGEYDRQKLAEIEVLSFLEAAEIAAVEAMDRASRKVNATSPVVSLAISNATYVSGTVERVRKLLGLSETAERLLN